jgi:hypothetical protein
VDQQRRRKLWAIAVALPDGYRRYLALETYWHINRDIPKGLVRQPKGSVFSPRGEQATWQYLERVQAILQQSMLRGGGVPYLTPTTTR